MPATELEPKRDRLQVVDWLRGLVMVVMALDHARGIFHSYGFNAADPAKSTVPLFVTRVVTHACGPTFVFLAGASVFLSLQRGRSRGELGRDLAIRGLWMILLEFTIVHLGFDWKLDWRSATGGVFWALGCSMILLSTVLWLPRWAVGLLGLAMVFGHNALDTFHAESWGNWRLAWGFLHEHVLLKWSPDAGFDWAVTGWETNVRRPKGDSGWSFRWPAIPWFGLMAAGYGFGPALLLDRPERRQLALRLGLLLIAGFVTLRGLNTYGDTHPWRTFDEPSRTGMSFFNVEKYGPSLLYAMMTLGPVFLLFAWADRAGRPPLPFLCVLGRVPLFFYLLHLPLIQLLRMATAPLRDRIMPDWLFGADFSARAAEHPAWHGAAHHWYLVVWAYVGAAATVAILYPLCVWFAWVKSRSRSKWLYYL